MLAGLSRMPGTSFTLTTKTALTKMNIVEATGGNKVQRQIAEDVVSYMIKRLMPRHRTLDITVELVDIKSDAVGFCMMCDRKREFVIEADKKQGIVQLVTTIVHEMIHVKQWVRNEMDDGCSGHIARWKSKTIPADTNYYDLPWEKEAYEKETYYSKLYLIEVHNGTPPGRRNSSGSGEA